MKIETSPVLVLDSFIVLRSKSYSFSNNTIQKAKQQGIQNTPKYADYKGSLFISKTANATNYSIRSNLRNITVEKQSKLGFESF